MVANLETHPASADLVAFTEGHAAATLSRKIEDHLTVCADCRDLVEALRDYGQEPEPSADIEALRVDSAEIDRALQSVLASLPGADEADSSDSSSAPVPDEEFSRRRREAADRAQPFIGWRELSIAVPWAALILVAVGWGINERRARVAPSLQQAVGNVPIVALQDVGNPLRSPNPGEVSISNGALITLADEQPFPEGPYSVGIEKESQEVMLKIGGLEPWPAGHISFLLLPDSLSPGRYEAVLSSPDGTPWPRRFVLQVAP